jgi:hypothetical protein
MTLKYNVVAELQNYMFSRTIPIVKPPPIVKKTVLKAEKVVSVVAPVLSSVPVVVAPVVSRVVEETVPILNPFFSPRMTDTLFWCFYVMKNGLVAYEQEPSTFVKEKEEKIKYILLLRNSKQLLKKHKITKLVDIENNLSLDKTINMATFFALCTLENMNAVVLQPKTNIYSDVCVNAESGTMFVLNQDKHRFKLVLDQSPISELTYEKTHFKLPLRSVSAYKLGDLRDICTRLRIIIPAECKKKQDIYSLITDVVNKID